MVEDVLKFKSGGEVVLQEYQETETLTDATRRQMINILVAHMIDTHGYFNYVCIYYLKEEEWFLNQITAWPMCKLR